jgi:hypothetical protein
MSYENLAPNFEADFRIKSASSSYYRGALFSPLMSRFEFGSFTDDAYIPLYGVSVVSSLYSTGQNDGISTA